MALTVDQLAYLRSEVGDLTPPTDDDLAAAYARLQGLPAVAAEVIRKRLANLLAAPAQFSADGYEQNNGANIAALSKQLARLDALAGPEPVTAISPVTIERIYPYPSANGYGYPYPFVSTR